MNVRSLLAYAALFLAASVTAQPVFATQLREGVRPVPKFTASLVLAGGGKMLPCVPKAFVHLAGERGRRSSSFTAKG